MILTPHKEYKRTVSASKRTFNFDEYHAKCLQDQKFDSMKAIQNKFKEEISNKIFSITDLKIKIISYELTPVKAFCQFFFFFFFAAEESDL